MNSFLHFRLNLLSVFISAFPQAGTPFSLAGTCGGGASSPKGCSTSFRERTPLVRQAKLGVSCRVKVSAEQGLTSHSYRVLQL
jgi:hypothetical protein